MGRAMLNICIVFAQLERETIQRRIADAYYSRSRKGMRTGGAAPYGYVTEPFQIQGIKTKRLVADPEKAENVKLMFEMYADPQTSLGEVARRFAPVIPEKSMSKARITDLLRNPVYVKADMDIYEFFKAQGAEIESDASDFTGITGCCLFSGKDSAKKDRFIIQGKVLIPSPHEGIVPSDVWIKCRKKLLTNPSYQPARKAKQTWLVGKVKCGLCGYALMSRNNAAKTRYMRCRKRAETKNCDGCGTVRTNEIEQLIYDSMVEKLREFKSLNAKSGVPANPKLTAVKVELAKVESEIEKLVESLTGASATLIQFANRKADELSARRQLLTKEVADLSADEIPAVRLTAISDYLDDWENTSLDDKRQVLDGLITVISAKRDNIEIEWKI